GWKQGGHQEGQKTDCAVFKGGHRCAQTQKDHHLFGQAKAKRKIPAGGAAQYKLYRAKPVPGTHEPSGGWLFPFVPGPWPPQGGAQGVYGASFVRGRSERWRSGGL